LKCSRRRSPASGWELSERRRHLGELRDFYIREREALTVIVCHQADLPASLGQKLIRRAMAEAFDNWEYLAAVGDPGEWVVGQALQVYRARRQPGADPARNPGRWRLTS
jgi:hypothetical protein